MTQYFNIDNKYIQNINAYIQSIFNTNNFKSILNSEGCNVVVNILHPDIHNILFDSCILLDDIIKIICYYVDYDINVHIKLIRTRALINVLTKIKISIRSSCFNYSLTCEINHGDVKYLLHINDNSSNIIEYTFKDVITEEEYSLNQLNIDQIYLYRDEIDFINYFMKDDKFINIKHDEYKHGIVNCDELIKSVTFLTFINHEIRTVTITRSIHNVQQLRINLHVLKHIVDVLVHAISNHFDTIKNKDTLNELL